MNVQLLIYILGSLVLVLAVAAGVWYRLRSRPYEITLSAAQIQKMVDTQLPLTTANGDITISKAAIDLSGNQAAADCVISYTSGGTIYSVAANATGVVRYDNQTASFYLRPTELRIDDINRNDLSIGQTVNSLIDLISGSSEKAEARKHWLKGGVDAAVQAVVQAAVRVGADELFSRIPVYTLPNHRTGKVARVILNDVQVSDGKLRLLLGGDK